MLGKVPLGLASMLAKNPLGTPRYYNENAGHISTRWGLRWTVVVSGAGTLALGSLLRCVSLDGEVLKWTSLLCGALNGWSSIMIECTLTVLSVKWFPANERTTATGVVIGIFIYFSIFVYIYIFFFMQRLRCPASSPPP